MWSIINLPNGTQQAIQLDSKSIGQECLEKVCRALGIVCEMEYFGLEYWKPGQKESNTHQWINLRNRLTLDGNNGGVQLLLTLRVKFWVPVHTILQDTVRDLFYFQAKADLLGGRLKALDLENSAKLSALLCQADGVPFNDISILNPAQRLTKKGVDINQCFKKCELKEGNDKDHALFFKKRRLSNKKSLEYIESINCNQTKSCNEEFQDVVSDNLQLSEQSLRTQAASMSHNCCIDNGTLTNIQTSHLHKYQPYIITSIDSQSIKADDILVKIPEEHSKLSKINMPSKSAKYWLLQEIEKLPGYGEEIFNCVTTNEISDKCDITVGASGIVLNCRNIKKISIPFSVIISAKSFRRNFKLQYINDLNEHKDLEVKLSKRSIAEALYRSITERHAFYVCDKVRGVVTNQFTRDLKGTIASMFNEDTTLGKRYVFDIKYTCREVHDHARRNLHEMGILTNLGHNNFYSDIQVDSSLHFSKMYFNKIDQIGNECNNSEAAIEFCVDQRISEAMACKICMDRPINTMFNPCCHITACEECASRCENCPYCRMKIAEKVRIYLPSELRSNCTNYEYA